MSCPNPYPDKEDPATLLPILLERMPEATRTGAGALRDAAHQLFTESHRWRKQDVQVACIQGCREYALPAPDIGAIVKIHDVWIRDDRNTERALIRDPSVRRIGVGQRWLEPIPGHFEMHEAPVPGMLNFRFSVSLRPGPDHRVPAQLIELYRHTILAGAKYRLVMAQGHKTEDQRAANMHMAEFQDGIRKAGRVYSDDLDAHREPYSRRQMLRDNRDRRRAARGQSTRSDRDAW